jgi:hypothetical protein
MSYLALGWGDDYGVLSARAVAYQQRLQKRLAELHEKADDSGKRPLLAQNGILHRLAGFLLQVRRIVEHKDQVLATLPQVLAQADPSVVAQEPHMALAAREATTDFESLLFHGRAVLDQQTFVVARHHHQDCDRAGATRGASGGPWKRSPTASRGRPS